MAEQCRSVASEFEAMAEQCEQVRAYIPVMYPVQPMIRTFTWLYLYRH